MFDTPVKRKANTAFAHRYGNIHTGYGWAGPRMRWCTAKLKDGPRELGFEPEPRFEDLQMTEEEELGLGRQRRDPWGEDGMQSSDVPDENELEEAYGLVVSIPREAAPDTAIENLKRMLQAKGTLSRTENSTML